MARSGRAAVAQFLCDAIAQLRCYPRLPSLIHGGSRRSRISFAAASRIKFAIALLLGASLLVGLAQIALLPPWEGFDETAHFSYIRFLVKNHDWPRHSDRLSLDVENYTLIGPGRYPSTPPYDNNGLWTYHQFFALPSDQIAQNAHAIHAPQTPAPHWQAGTRANWQAQHPPLYYVLLAPFYAASATWSLVDQLLLLRGISYLVAWLGLCVAVWANSRMMPRAASIPPALLLSAPALWPFIFPGWFIDTARLGNDSLVVLLSSIAWAFLVLSAQSKRPIVGSSMLGGICGLGLLTKATFLPFTAAILGWLLVDWRIRHRDDTKRRMAFARIASFIVVVCALAGWWYLVKRIETGNLVGSTDVTLLDETGGLLSGWTRFGSVALLIKGWAGLVASFTWSGTWSYVRPPLLVIAPLAVSTLLMVAAHLWWLRTESDTRHWLPAATLALFLVGLSVHLVIFIASRGSAGTPAWYLHSFAPVFSIIPASALAVALRSAALTRLFGGLLGYTFLFLPIAVAFNALVYAGCGTKASLANTYDYKAMAACLSDTDRVVENLAVLASPRLAELLFVLGYALLIAGLAVLFSSGRLTGKLECHPSPWSAQDVRH